MLHRELVAGFIIYKRISFYVVVIHEDVMKEPALSQGQSINPEFTDSCKCGRRIQKVSKLTGA